jgi:hypothetical protein
MNDPLSPQLPKNSELSLPTTQRHWFSLIEGRKLYWVGVREKRSQYKLRRK